MKKILVFLGSLGILGSSVMAVVSCGVPIAAAGNLIGAPEKISLKKIETGHVELEQANWITIYNEIQEKVKTLIEESNIKDYPQLHVDYEIVNLDTKEPISDLPSSPMTLSIEALGKSEILTDSFNYVLWKDINFEFTDPHEFPAVGTVEEGEEVLKKIEEVLKKYFPNRNPKDFYYILHDKDNWMIESKEDSELKFSFTYNKAPSVFIGGLEHDPFNIDHATKQQIEAEVQRLVNTRVKPNVVSIVPKLGKDYEIQNLVYNESTDKPAYAGVATVVKDPKSLVVEGSFDFSLMKILPLDLSTSGTVKEGEEVLKQIHQEFKKWNNDVEPVKEKDYEIIFENHGWTIHSTDESTVQLRDNTGLHDFHYTIIDAMDISDWGFNLDLDKSNGELLTFNDINQEIKNKISKVVDKAQQHVDYEIDYTNINFDNNIPQNIGEVIVNAIPNNSLTGSFKVGLTKTVDLTNFVEAGWASEWDNVKTTIDQEIKKWLRSENNAEDYYSIFKNKSRIIVSSKPESLLKIKNDHSPEGYVYTFNEPFNLETIPDLNIYLDENENMQRSDLELIINNYLKSELAKTKLTFPDPNLNYYKIGKTPINKEHGNLYVGNVIVSANKEDSEFLVGSFNVNLKINLKLPLENNRIIETDEEWNKLEIAIKDLISKWDPLAVNNGFSNYVIEPTDGGWVAKSKENSYVIFNYVYRNTRKTDLSTINDPLDIEFNFSDNFNDQGFTQVELEQKVQNLIQTKVDADKNNNNFNKIINPLRDYEIQGLTYNEAGRIQTALNFYVVAKPTSPLIVGTMEIRLIKPFDWNKEILYSNNNFIQTWYHQAVNIIKNDQVIKRIRNWSLPGEAEKNYIEDTSEDNVIVIKPVLNSNIRFAPFTIKIFVLPINETKMNDINIDDSVNVTKTKINEQIDTAFNTLRTNYGIEYYLWYLPQVGPFSSHYHFEGLEFVNNKITRRGILKVIANPNDKYLKGSFEINFVKTLSFRDPTGTRYPTHGTSSKALEVIENINNEISKWMDIGDKPTDYYNIIWNDTNTVFTIVSTKPYLKFSFIFTIDK